MAAEDMTLQSSNYFYVGVDGGGTKCRAEAYNAKGEVIGAGVAGPANVARAADIARQSIVNAVAAALADAGLAAPEQLRKTAVGAGRSEMVRRFRPLPALLRRKPDVWNLPCGLSLEPARGSGKSCAEDGSAVE
mgnify:CR=1 FL=1